MQLQKYLLHFATALGLVFCGATVGATEITLTLATLPHNNHVFFHKLLEKSLQAQGHVVKIVPVESLTQPHIVAKLGWNEVTLHWLLETKERDAAYVPVVHKLTGGLIGQRVMLIPKGQDARYAAVKTLDDLKTLGVTGGLGQGWFDVDVWKQNGLKFMVESDWPNLYKMVASMDRGVDYFPRGASEIAGEAKSYPDLMIEPRLVLTYPRDLRFYLSKSDAALKPVIETALKAAERSGLQKKLIDQYYAPTLAVLKLEKRVKINMKVAE